MSTDVPASMSVPGAAPQSITPEAFKAEVATWARRIGVEPQSVHVRPMTRKWASCSSKARLTFDVDLLAQPAEFRRRVIVHELLHPKVPNHAKLFRSLLRAYLGTTAESVTSQLHADGAAATPRD